jgi:hypothetical protein
MSAAWWASCSRTVSQMNRTLIMSPSYIPLRSSMITKVMITPITHIWGYSRRAGFRSRNRIWRHVARELRIGRTSSITAPNSGSIHWMNNWVSPLMCNPSVIHMRTWNEAILRPMWIAQSRRVMSIVWCIGATGASSMRIAGIGCKHGSRGFSRLGMRLSNVTWGWKLIWSYHCAPITWWWICICCITSRVHK